MAETEALMACPYCRGDGCDPNDTGTAIVADCNACNGEARVPRKLAALILTAMQEKWEWPRFLKARAEL